MTPIRSLALVSTVLAMLAACSAPEPTPPAAEVVAAARRDGARRVVVASYLLAPGYFQNTLPGVGADLVSAPLLSPSPEPEVVDLVVRRFERAARTLSWEPPSTFDRARH